MPSRVSAAFLRLDEQPHALYRFYDRTDVLLYVGITADLPTRLRHHGKHKNWSHQVSYVRVEQMPGRRAALDAEREAIKNEKPLFNDQHNDIVPLDDHFAALTTSEKLERLSLAERDSIAVPAHLEGMRELAEAILECIYDPDGDMPDIRRRVERRDEEDRYGDESIDLALAAMEQAADRVTELEYALMNLLHAFPQEQREADERAAKADCAAFHGGSETQIDVLARTALFARRRIFGATYHRLSADEQAEWMACARGESGDSADEAELRATAGQMAQVYAEERRVLGNMCWADAGQWAKCPNRAAFKVWPEGECLECDEQSGNQCRGHAAFCADHMAQALEGTLIARAGDRLLAQRVRIGRHEEIPDPWAANDPWSDEPPF